VKTASFLASAFALMLALWAAIVIACALPYLSNLAR